MGMKISSSDESNNIEQLSEVDAGCDFPHDGGISDVPEQSESFLESPETIRPILGVRGRRPLSRTRRGQRGSRTSSTSPTRSPVREVSPEPIRPRGRVRGRRPLSRTRSGQRGGRPASRSRTRSPIHEGGDSGDDEWSQDPTPPEILPFTEVPRLCIPVPTGILGFFQIFFSVEVLRYFCIETNAYAQLQREELGDRSAYAWKDCVVGDI